MNNLSNNLKKLRPFLATAIGLIVAFMFFGRFISRLLLTYSLPMLYLYLRLRSRIRSRNRRRWFALIFVLLLLGFPLAETLSHLRGLPDMTPLVTAAYLCMPFLFYLFLFNLVIDLFLLLNRLVKVLPRDLFRKRKIRLAGLLVPAFLSLVVVALGYWNHSVIRVNEYQIEIPGNSSALSSLRVVLASDFHLGSQTRRWFVEKCVDRINSLAPDVVLLPGDILEGDRHDLDLEPFQRQFRRLEATYGVFASPGNHEFHGRWQESGFFQNAGITMLKDERVTIGRAFVLAGRSDGRRKKRKSLKELLDGVPDSLPVFLMDHRPRRFEEVSRYRVDVQVSGHTHNGQLFPLNLIFALMHDLNWGHKKIADTHFFVTCGIQLWGPPVRTAGVSELMVINVTFSKQQ